MDGEALRQALITWGTDLSCTTDSTGCAGYEDFEYWLERGVFADELGDGTNPTEAAARYVGTETAHEFLTRLVKDPSSPWWDDTSTPTTTETRNQVIASALDKAASELKSSLGSDSSKWTWGRIHSATFQEQTLGTSGIGPLEWIFNKGPYAAPGSCTTVFKVCGDIAGDWPMGDGASDLQARFAAASSPSYRLVVDMSDLDGATIIQTTGQSGVPFDSHYGDFIERWLNNDPLPLPWTDSAVDATTKQVLTLSP
jgi:penicillin amidase